MITAANIAVTCSTAQNRVAEVRQDFPHVRADHEVQQQAEQHLDIERDDQKQSPQIDARHFRDVSRRRTPGHRRERGAHTRA